MNKQIDDVIKKESEGYVIYSEKGKRLSKAYSTKKAAEERLKQIEMFKHMKKDSNILDLPLGIFKRIINLQRWNESEENSETKNLTKLLTFGWNFRNDYLEEGITALYEEVKKIHEFNRTGKEFANKGLGSANYRQVGELLNIADGLKQLSSDIKDELLTIKDQKPWAYKPSFREYLLKIYNLIGGEKYMKDSLEKIELDLDEELDKLVQQGYEEYCKCVEKNPDGQFEYSEKLIELLNKISEFTTTTEAEILGMYKEMADQEEVKGKEIQTKELKDSAEELLDKYIGHYVRITGKDDKIIDGHLSVYYGPKTVYNAYDFDEHISWKINPDWVKTVEILEDKELEHFGSAVEDAIPNATEEVEKVYSKKTGKLVGLRLKKFPEAEFYIEKEADGSLTVGCSSDSSSFEPSDVTDEDWEMIEDILLRKSGYKK